MCKEYKRNMKKRIIPFSPPDISEAEIEEVVKTMRSGWITTGPRTKLLERRLAAFIETGCVDVDCNTEENIEKYSNRVVCLSSATAAEELNLRIWGIQPGDEVIVPAYTYTSTAAAAIHCGAKVIFVDCQKDGNPETHAPEMDYEKVDAAITEKTKAIIPVDIAGIICDYEKIYDIINRKKKLFTPVKSDGTSLGDLSSRIQNAIGTIAIVADCAHSLGASRSINGKKKHAGNIAHFSSYSFHAVKNLTTAEGGAATWLPVLGIDDKEIYSMYQLLSLHGQSKDANAKTNIGAWEYDIVSPLYKCNMTDIMAAIGLKQLDRYQFLLDKRKEIIRKYDEACNRIGIDHLVHYTDNYSSSGHLYITRLKGCVEKQRRDIIAKMTERGIACNVHFKPLPMMTAYKHFGWAIEDFPNAYLQYENSISLPLNTCLDQDDVNYIINNWIDVVKEYVRK